MVLQIGDAGLRQQGVQLPGPNRVMCPQPHRKCGEVQRVHARVMAVGKAHHATVTSERPTDR